jgi:hypothetical protein
MVGNGFIPIGPGDDTREWRMQCALPDGVSTRSGADLDEWTAASEPPIPGMGIANREECDEVIAFLGRLR